MITTAPTEMFGLQHPIVLGPMGGVSGGMLAAAVSNAGGRPAAYGGLSVRLGGHVLDEQDSGFIEPNRNEGAVQCLTQ